MMLQGEEAVRLARSAVEAEVSGRPAPAIPGTGAFSDSAGAFVTLDTFPAGELRGCIGIPMPVMPLGQAIVEAAGSACNDPRFPRLSPGELGGVTVEVTVQGIGTGCDRGSRSKHIIDNQDVFALKGFGSM